jgi:pimeloyl-ACP methyl ester carboxylesterase
MTSWRRIAGIAAGTAVAGAGAAVAVQRIAAHRLRLYPDPAADEPLGELRGREFVVLAPDGAPLHVEVNGPDDAPVTIIFCHGFALHQDSWHYQRRDLGTAARLVFWDQRGHGRSGRTAGQPVTVEQTGADLNAIIRAMAPGRTRVVLVGHSMGGMTIMALAGGHPELFGRKVVGVVLIATAAAGLSSPDGLVPWLPPPLRGVLQRAAPALLRGASSGRGAAALVERGRLVSRELELVATRFLAFGDPKASQALTDFVERMIREAPVGVIAEFYGTLLASDLRDGLGPLARVPVTVVAGERDHLIPARLGAELAAAIPGAQLVMLPDAGHVPMLEHPDVISDVIASLVDEVAPGADARKSRQARGEGGVRGVA